MKRFVLFNMEKMKLGEMFCRNQAPLVVPDHCILYQLVEVTALNSKERRKTVRAKRPAQQAKDAIKPADYEYCPHCKGSFSFAKLGSNFKCKWCKKDVRTSGRLA